MKKICIFDFDGTLYNTMPDVAKRLDKTLKQEGFPQLTYTEYEQAVGGDINQIMDKILKNNSTPETIEKLKKTYEHLAKTMPDEASRPYPEIQELLEKIQEKNIKIAINSNRHTEDIKKYTQKYLENITFTDIKGYNPKTPSKPDPTDLLNIIEKHEIQKEDAIYIGDTQTDIKTAKNAGIDCVIVTWGQGTSTDYKNENILKAIDKPSQLLKIIL
ncbi:HAD family hydrolase [Methanosphaera sp.]